MVCTCEEGNGGPKDGRRRRPAAGAEPRGGLGLARSRDLGAIGRDQDGSVARRRRPAQDEASGDVDLVTARSVREVGDEQVVRDGGIGRRRMTQEPRGVGGLPQDDELRSVLCGVVDASQQVGPALSGVAEVGRGRAQEPGGPQRDAARERVFIERSARVARACLLLYHYETRAYEEAEL